MDVIATAKTKLKLEFAEGYAKIFLMLEEKKKQPENKAKAEELEVMAKAAIEQDNNTIEDVKHVFSLVAVPKRIEKNWKAFVKSVPKDW